MCKNLYTTIVLVLQFLFFDITDKLGYITFYNVKIQCCNLFFFHKLFVIIVVSSITPDVG